MSQSPLPDKYFNNVPSDGNNFDQVPIGANANKFVISQYADADGQILENLEPIVSKNLTLVQKISSKTIKIKLQGLEQLKTMLSNNQNLQQLQFQLSKILKENNPACLEKALQCAQKWIQLGRTYTEKQIKQIIQNGCLNGKGNTKKLASDLVYKAFEKKPEDVQRSITQIGFKSKVPKVIGGYLAVLNQLLEQFGVKDLKYLKPYVPLVVNIMNNQKLPIIKQQGMNFLKSGLKWLGKDFMWPLFIDLKQNMKKQLQSFWQGHDKKQVMRAKRQKNVQNSNLPNKNVKNNKPVNEQKGQQFANQGNQGLDIYEISDPIDVIQKFDQKWSETVLSTQKWNSKIAMLQQLITKAGVPKIANTEHRHLTQMIRRLINDSNFNVVLSVLKLSSALAKGLRRNFTHSAKILFPYITPKFRDKKTQMIDQTFNTLNSFYYCFSIEEVGQDVKAALKDKTAGMKINIVKWIINFMERKQSDNNCNSLDKLSQFFKSSAMLSIFESLLNDPSAQVRDSTAKLVCKIRNLFGDGLFKNIDKNINNKQLLQKLNEAGTCGQNQQIQSKSRGKDTSNKKLKSASKTKSTKNLMQDVQDFNQNSYSFKTTNLKGNQTLDITQQINKNIKKLNDNANWQNRKQSAQKLIKFLNTLQKQNPQAKISSSLLYDFLGILKSRISDPNKQLIKIFVNLIGQVFRCLPQKQAKIQSKSFIQQLIQAFSDKNQTNRKQIHKTLDRIANAVGNQTILGYFGQLLSQQSNNSTNTQMNSVVKQYTLQYLLSSSYFNNKIEQIDGPNNLKQLKQFPKIILSSLCDKNKQLRTISQKIFKLMCQRTGIELFRNFVNSKQQKLMFKNDLVTFLDKFQGTNNINQQPSMISYVSNGSLMSINIRQTDHHQSKSPSVHKSKMHAQQNNHSQKIKRKYSNTTSLNHSRSKAKNNSILGGVQQNSKDFTSNLVFCLKGQTKKVDGNQLFANLQLLTTQRVLRQQTSTKYRNNTNNHPITQQLQIQHTLSRLIHYQQLYLKMYSNDYTKNIQAANKIIKICRDVAQTSSVRQISDLIIKWVIIKLYGGNVGCLGLMDVVAPVLSVLEKKRIAWTDYDVQMLVVLVREYGVGMFYQGNQNLEIIKSIFKLAIALSSGERIVKKLLNQIKIDISQHHRHLTNTKKQGISCNKFYKKMLIQICGFLVDYFSNDRLLQQAAGIPQLSQDQQFVRLLANKFHDGVLKQFGFRLQSNNGNGNGNYGSFSYTENGVNLQRSFHNAQKNSGALSPRSVSPGIAFFGVSKNKHESKQKKITPQKIINNTTLTQSRFPPPSPLSKNKNTHNPSNTYQHQSQQQQPQHQNVSNKKQPITMTTIYRNTGIQPTSPKYQIDLSSYPQPNHHNPLGINLLKLFPYNESSIHFFSTLFQPQNQTSDKITSELSLNCNIIYGYLFNTLMKMMQLSIRQTQGPERVATFTSLVQQSIKCPNIFRNLNELIIERSIRYIIDQLVYEDQNRNNIQAKLRNKGFNDFKNDIFVKGINGVMLRLLDNSFPLLLVNSLLLNLMEIIIQQKGHQQQPYHHHLSNVNKNKKVGLIIRCFIRVINSYFNQPQQKQKQTQVYNIEQDPNCLKTHHIHRFILLTRQYLQIMHITDLLQFQIRQEKNLRGDKNMSLEGNIVLQNTQESVIYSLCKIYRVLQKKNLLVKNYDYLRKQKIHLKDQRTISDYISMICGISFPDPYPTTHPHTHAHSNPYSNILQSSQNSNFIINPSTSTTPNSATIDQQFKKIIQMLSKSKTFTQGVKLLKGYISQQGGKFDYKSMVFIQRVSQQLGKLGTLNSQPSSRSLNPDIQNKLQRLKMKLQGINNQHSKSITQKDTHHEQKQPQHHQHQKQKSTTTSKVSYINTSQTTNIYKPMQYPTPKSRDLSTRSIEQSQVSQQNDLKKRIQEMKNKVNMSTNKLR